MAADAVVNFIFDICPISGFQRSDGIFGDCLPRQLKRGRALRPRTVKVVKGMERNNLNTGSSKRVE